MPTLAPERPPDLAPEFDPPDATVDPLEWAGLCAEIGNPDFDWALYRLVEADTDGLEERIENFSATVEQAADRTRDEADGWTHHVGAPITWQEQLMWYESDTEEGWIIVGERKGEKCVAVVAHRSTTTV